MPARPDVPNVLRIDLHQLDNGVIPVINHFFASFASGTTTPAKLDAIAAAAGGEWSSVIAPLAATSFQLAQVVVTDLTTTSSPVGSDSTLRGGTNADPFLDAGTAVVIQRKITRRYRGGHSRVYLGGRVQTQLQGPDIWSSAFQTAILSAWEALEAAVQNQMVLQGLSGADPVNVSYYEGFTNFTYPSGRVRPIPKLRTTPLVDFIATWAVNPKPATQRRRLEQSA